MKKDNLGSYSIWMSLVEILVGILLLINPMGFTAGIIITFGVVLAVMGIGQIIGYFGTDAEAAASGGKLTKGVLFSALGIFCTFKSAWFIATFPVITILYGVIIFIAGASKLQRAIDMGRLKQKYWFIALIGAILTILFAALIIFDPFKSTAVLWNFIGVTLIVEAFVDIITFIFARKS